MKHVAYINSVVLVHRLKPLAFWEDFRFHPWSWFSSFNIFRMLSGVYIADLEHVFVPNLKGSKVVGKIAA